MTTRFGYLAPWLGALVLGACVSPGDAPVVTPITTDGEGRCFASETTPAVVETVTEQIIVQPAMIDSDGTVRSPAAFRTVTRQRILRERREVQFETLCHAALTSEFVGSLQRALGARGFYRGDINGVLDARTGRAIQVFQRQNGSHDLPVLDIETARTLGLVALSSTVLDSEG